MLNVKRRDDDEHLKNEQRRGDAKQDTERNRSGAFANGSDNRKIGARKLRKTKNKKKFD